MAELPTWLNELHDAMELLEKGQPKLCLTALHAMLQDHGKDDFCRALVFDGMGRALFAEKKPDLGMEAFEESLKILRNLFAENKISPEILQGALQNQAHAFLVIKDYPKAQKLGEEAQELADKTWGSNSPQAAEAMFHLSAVYYEQQNYDKAETLLLRAKDILEAQSGPTPELVGTILNNLGRIYEERGKPDHGATYHRRAVDLRRTMDNKLDLAFSLGNYGVALGSAGKLSEACDALREAIVIYNALGYADSPEVKAYTANLELFEKELSKG